MTPFEHRRLLSSLLVALAACSSPSHSDDATGGAAGAPGQGGAPAAQGGSAGTAGSSTSGGSAVAGTSSGGAPNSGSGGASSGGSLSGGAGNAANGGAGNAANGGKASGGTTSANGGSSAASGGKASGGATGATGGSPAASGGKASGGTQSASGGTGALTPLTVHIAGDSTVSTYTLDPNNPKSQAGWGQMLAPLYDGKATIVNDAIGGRTARRYIQEGRLEAILKVIKAGDYLLIQFGTNDSNTTATYDLNGTTYPYYAAADGDFKTYLTEYIAGAKSKNAIPVLVTPPPRNSAYCNGGRSLGNYGQAMLDLGKAEGVAVVDLGLKAHSYLKAICPKPTTGDAESFFKVNADNSIDGTHFQENGARYLAGFVADGIGEASLGLNAYRKK